MYELAINPINSDPEVKSQVRATKVTLCDVTLRDGELAVPGGFRPEDYLRIAHILDEIGIPMLQVSYPGVYPEHKAAVIALKKEKLAARLEVKVQATAANWRQQIEDCLESGADQISLQFRASRRFQRAVNPDWTEDKHIDAMQAAVRYGSERGGNMEVTANDGSRADIPYLLRYFRAVVEAGAVATRLNESVPAMSPLAFKYMVGKVKEVLPIPLAVHCHNSWGLALANVCAAVEAGAEIVDASVNGLAGHAGNVALDEAVMTFQYLYGFDMGIRTERLTEASRLLEVISGQQCAATKPVVGRNLYAHSGYHRGTKDVLRIPQTMEPFPPEMVGNKRRWPLQWDTSDAIIRFRLDEMGVDEASVDVDGVRDAVVQFARSKRREMEDDEFEKLLKEKRR